MTDRQREFLEKLNELMAQYNAGFGYTRDDDGIHIFVDGEECFVGWLDTDMGINDFPGVMRNNT